MPGVRNVDVNLVKNFNFTEAAKVQFRCEVFNLFNHPQVWGINTGFSGDNPGSAISTSDKNFGQASSIAMRELCNWLSGSASNSPVRVALQEGPAIGGMASGLAIVCA